MADRKRPYPFDEFEPAWQKRWDEEKTFHVSNPGEPGFDASKPKRYILDMFPYPSGAGLHVGHPEGYTATDIVSRFLRRNGYNVLHPMGWDSFGLPAEQYAIKTGQHPSITTASNIDTFRRQLKMLGFSYDWDREIATTDPKYVRWTQWIFLRLYNSYYNTDLKKSRPISELEDKGWTHEQIDSVRLAYVAEGMVNWSPDMGTVLANEEAEEWRSKGFTIERRKLRQWTGRKASRFSSVIGLANLPARRSSSPVESTRLLFTRLDQTPFSVPLTWCFPLSTNLWDKSPPRSRAKPYRPTKKPARKKVTWSGRIYPRKKPAFSLALTL